MGKQIILKRGDVVWVTFDPVVGHEQNGRRPAIIISPELYNAKTGLAVVCPITSQVKGFPFEVVVSVKTITGVILADQVRVIDWGERVLSVVGSVNEETLKEVQDKLSALIL